MRRGSVLCDGGDGDGGGLCVVDCDCVFVIQGADLPLWHGFKGSILVGPGF